MRRATFLLSAITLASTFVCHLASAEVDYELRAQTKDRVRNITYFAFIDVDPFVVVRSGNAKLGSFGAPAINDRGAVSFSAILFGKNVDSFNNGGVFYQRSKRKTPEITVQTGAVLDSSFRGEIPDKSRYILGSSRAFRFGKDVAVTKNNQTAFSGEFLYEYRTVSDPDDEGNITFGDPVEANYGGYGSSSKKGGNFPTFAVYNYQNFNEELLSRTLSFNKQGNVPARAGIIITDTKTLEGILFQGYKLSGGLPDYTRSVVATVESPVIGLPYFTIFSSFSDPIISDKNKLFVVADISDEGDEFDGIWQGNNPNLQPIVVKDTRAPGGGTFASFDGTIGPNPKGSTVAFIANVEGGDPRAAFRSGVTGKDITRVAAVGDVAPSNEASGGLGRFSDLELVAANNRGQIAVLGSVDGNGDGTRSGIWVSDKAGNNLELIVVEGQDMNVDGSTKRLNRIAFNPVSGFNNRGEVAFTASFSDRTSAVFVASVR